MSEELNLEETQKHWNGTYKAYFIGFGLSVLLTLLSFGLVVSHRVERPLLVYLIVGLALVQAVVQLLFFLHVREGAKPRWEMGIFYFMVTILLIVVLGSLWIMHDLDDRVMSGMLMGMPK